MNPFESKEAYHGRLKLAVRATVRSLEQGESTMADTMGKSIASYRATLNKMCKEDGYIVRTTVCKQGNLWIKRLV